MYMPQYIAEIISHCISLITFCLNWACFRLALSYSYQCLLSLISLPDRSATPKHMSSASASSHRPPSSSAATSGGGGGGGKVDMFTASASRSSPQRPTSTAQQRPTPQRNQPQQQQSRNNRPSMLVSVFFWYVHVSQHLHVFLLAGCLHRCWFTPTRIDGL